MKLLDELLEGEKTLQLLGERLDRESWEGGVASQPEEEGLEKVEGRWSCSRAFREREGTAAVW